IPVAHSRTPAPSCRSRRPKRSSTTRGASTRWCRSGRMSDPVSGRVRILFLDVDGTMTDGGIGWDTRGGHRNFFVRHRLALDRARGLGLLPVVTSGRDSEAVKGRMLDLGLEHYLGIRDKVAVAEQVLTREEVLWNACAAVGDDLPDVPLLKRVGWPIAVA